MKKLFVNNIDRAEWSRLVASSATGTWFQTPKAYDFFASMPDLFLPFVVGVANNPSIHQSSNPSLQTLRAVCCGYVTKERSALKQFFTRRAIIIGGPALADDATEEEVEALMSAIKDCLSFSHSLIHSFLHSPIYIETRNFNDYSRWKNAFAAAGFDYQPHLNFHVHTDQPWDTIEANIGKHRKKYIRLSFRDGATIEENPAIEQVRAYYDILSDLYRTKVKMPLLPWSFFEKLYYCENCKYLLVIYNGLVVGGSICMLLQNHGVYEWYACGKDGIFKNIYPSSVTKYAGMKYAYDNDYAIFDMMGAGKPNEEYGVRDFKAEFGGELVEYGRFLCVTIRLLYKVGLLGIYILKLIQ